MGDPTKFSHATAPKNRFWAFFEAHVVRGFLAVFIIIAFVAYTGFAIFGFNDAAMLDVVITAFSGIVGAVIGFFFGARSMDHAEWLTKSTQSQSARLQSMTLEDAKKLEKLETDIQDLVMETAGIALKTNSPSLHKKVSHLLTELERRTHDASP